MCLLLTVSFSICQCILPLSVVSWTAPAPTLCSIHGDYLIFCVKHEWFPAKPSQKGAFIQNAALSRCLLGSLAAIISIRKRGNLKKIYNQISGPWIMVLQRAPPSGCWVQASSLRRRHRSVQKGKGHSQHNVPVLSNHSRALSKRC